MAKSKLTDFDATAANNEDIGNISILGTAAPSNFDNAFRELMAQIAKANAGTDPVADTWTFGDPADLTKRVRLDAGSVTAGQTRVITVPDEDVALHNRMGHFKTTYVTASGTHTFDASTKYAEVEVIGGGGAGGGPASPGANNAAAGSGGGAGGWAKRFFSTSGISSGTVTIGAAGTGSGGSNGGDGGNSSWDDGTNTVTSNGGAGGSAGTAAGSQQAAAGGLGGAASGGSLSIRGNPGGASMSSGTTSMGTTVVLAQGGDGGFSMYGSAGRGLTLRTSGNTALSGEAASGYGAGGGGGAAANASATAAGGNGAPGLVIVREYR